MELDYATMFSVDYYEGDAALITVAGNQRYLLLPGDEADDSTSYGDLPDDVILLHRNPRRVYLASSSCMDFWRELDALDNVWFTSTKRQDWDLSEAARRMDDGMLEFIGKYSAPDVEYLLSEGCDFAVENTMIYHTPDTLEQLRELGIPTLVEYSSYEGHPLGRLEWIRLWGLIAGCEKQADAYFEKQVETISQDFTEETSSTAANITPSVAYFSVNANGMVRVPKESSYVPMLIALAGGEYVFSDNEEIPSSDTDNDATTNASSSMNMQMEPFYAAAKDADVLIYNGTIEGGISSVRELIAKNELFADFTAVKTGQVWCQSGDLFQHPTQVAQEVADFSSAMQGEKDGSLTYLKRCE